MSGVKSEDEDLWGQLNSTIPHSFQLDVFQSTGSVLHLSVLALFSNYSELQTFGWILIYTQVQLLHLCLFIFICIAPIHPPSTAYYIFLILKVNKVSPVYLVWINKTLLKTVGDDI